MRLLTLLTLACALPFFNFYEFAFAEGRGANVHLLLLGNTENDGTPPLHHAVEAINRWRGSVSTLLFVPFAAIDRVESTEKIRKALSPLGIKVDQMTDDETALKAIKSAQAVYVGGGNTFRLLNTLQRHGLLIPLRKRILEGLPYMGSSAGANIVAPTIMTTNDMPIVAPESMNALGILPFQINPHFNDNKDPVTHETREDRLREYVFENKIPVLALRQGAWVLVDGERVVLGGAGARVFRHQNKGEKNEPMDYSTGTELNFDLHPR